MKRQTRSILLLATMLVFGGGRWPLCAQNSPQERLGAGVDSGPGKLPLGKDVGGDTPRTDEIADPPGATVIRALKRTVFDPKQNKVIFRGSVLVEDPRFTLKCDILTAYIKKAASADKKQAASQSVVSGAGTLGSAETKSKPEAGARGIPEEPAASGGLESAEAEGNVEIVQDRVTPEGKIERNVLRAQKAVYNSATEGITLTGWPQVWQTHNGNSLKALREDTVMVLNKSGDVDITGPTKSVFVNPSKNGK